MNDLLKDHTSSLGVEDGTTRTKGISDIPTISREAHDSPDQLFRGRTELFNFGHFSENLSSIVVCSNSKWSLITCAGNLMAKATGK